MIVFFSVTDCQIEWCKLPLKKKEKKERQVAKRKENAAKQRNRTIDVISTTWFILGDLVGRDLSCHYANSNLISQQRH